MQNGKTENLERLPRNPNLHKLWTRVFVVHKVWVMKLMPNSNKLTTVSSDSTVPSYLLSSRVYHTKISILTWQCMPGKVGFAY